MPKKPDKPQRDSTARVVDRLLRQLPGADPTLKGDPEPPSLSDRPQPSGTDRPQMSGPRPGVGRTVRSPRPPQPWGVWGRFAGTVVLGIALTQWPYRSECGWSLYGYLAAVTVVLLAAGWTAVTAWRLQMGIAHTLALVAGFWGIVLAAEQILPRVGYAVDTQYWKCSSLRAAQAAAAARVPAPPIVVPMPAADSLGTDSLAPDSAPSGTVGTEP